MNSRDQEKTRLTKQGWGGKESPTLLAAQRDIYSRWIAIRWKVVHITVITRPCYTPSINTNNIDSILIHAFLSPHHYSVHLCYLCDINIDLLCTKQ